MSVGDRLGGEELTQKEFDEADLRHEEVLADLYEVVAQRDEAKKFLNTKFGIALRKVLVAEKLKAMKACAENVGKPDQTDNIIRYKVIKKVEYIFGLIISDGNQALTELKMQTGDDDEHEN